MTSSLLTSKHCADLPVNLNAMRFNIVPLLTKQEWIDDFLQWNPAAYDGIKQLVLPPRMVWLPDFAISNR
jgi:hypothetical protein